MIFFTSDPHFGDKRIIKNEPRRKEFKTVKEMDNFIIERWNDVVAAEDTIYILGDFFKGRNPNNITEIMELLNGKKILIKGNNDTEERLEVMRPFLESEHDLLEVDYEEQKYILCHYPMLEWKGQYRGSIHLYGHVHSSQMYNGILSASNSYHVGLDTNDLTPVSIDQINSKLIRCKHENISKSNYGTLAYCLDCGKCLERYIINGKQLWL